MEVVVISKPAGLVWLLGEAHGSVKARGFVTCGGGRTSVILAGWQSLGKPQWPQDASFG